MKRVRWDGAYFRVSNGEPECRLLFSEEHIDCEKHAEWREIESGTLDMESGKLRLVLKPVGKPRTAMVEIELPSLVGVRGINVYCFYSDGSYVSAMCGLNSDVHHALVSLADEYKSFSKVDLSAHAKPSKYTDEAVDEFLEAVSVRNKNGNQFHLHWLEESKDDLVENGSERLWDAFHVLKKQRETAQ